MQSKAYLSETKLEKQKCLENSKRENMEWNFCVASKKLMIVTQTTEKGASDTLQMTEVRDQIKAQQQAHFMQDILTLTK